MKLIQKIAFCAILALMRSASASTLFWQVNPDGVGPLGWDGTGDPTYAVLKATTGTLAEGVGIAAYDLSEGKAWATDLGDYGNSTYSFFVELINASGKVYTQKAATSYNDLLSSGYVSASALDRPTGALSGGFNGAAVPEPTSGVLLLIGGAMLALRRRRRM